MKAKVNKKRKRHLVKEGDKVYMDTKNLTDAKLEKPYTGPFEVKTVRENVAFLSLPGTKVFPKFYVSLLKKAPPGEPLCTSWNFSTQQEYKVEAVVGEKVENGETMFLVKWEGYPDSESTSATSATSSTSFLADVPAVHPSLYRSCSSPT